MKKKHDRPLTEDMLNELNKTSLSGGYSGSVPPLGPNAYDNYGQDQDEFYDMEDVWNNDRYYGQQKYKVSIPSGRAADTCRRGWSNGDKSDCSNYQSGSDRSILLTQLWL